MTLAVRCPCQAHSGRSASVQRPERRDGCLASGAVSRRQSSLFAGQRGQQPLEVLAARAARAQVRGNARVALLRGGAGLGQLGVNVQHLHRLAASHIARVGAQEAVQR